MSDNGKLPLPIRTCTDCAQDQDAIDFTDNDLSSLENFPFFPRLRTLLLARNRINHIQSALGSSVPNLSTIALTSNNLSELADLEPLRTLPKLTHLILLENPVTRKEVRNTGLVILSISVAFVGSNGALELPILGYLARAVSTLSRLPKSEGCGTCQSEGTFWNH